MFSLFFVILSLLCSGINVIAKDLPSCKPPSSKQVRALVSSIDYNPIVMAMEAKNPHKNKLEKRSILNETELNSYLKAGTDKFDLLVDSIHEVYTERFQEKNSIIQKRSIPSPTYFGSLHKETSKLPWVCDYVEEWQYLGLNYFPIFLKNIICMQSKCGLSPKYACKSNARIVQVLRWREEECDDTKENPTQADNPMDTMYSYYPDALQKNWVTEDRVVVTGCSCDYAETRPRHKFVPHHHTGHPARHPHQHRHHPSPQKD